VRKKAQHDRGRKKKMGETAGSSVWITHYCLEGISILRYQKKHGRKCATCRIGVKEREEGVGRD